MATSNIKKLSRSDAYACESALHHLIGNMLKNSSLRSQKGL